ncbi:uncharacterized protein BDR25DRAFT_354250 [Lindgomyces ingoldianus]|uniref:Uncharacterized protein n=1 Tax=Lindgomyces ingoldianus TaxID=673940 RepID=A0ACB6QZR5_9PLEO|nr:uncharacterized protein BDR25DRAFT_354250 [Lindgomyces ingoldianus]KAF2471762.1 hypothetical protein BDR25DRAFT_354250 [Lindgomyces ingoldianus]
MLALHTLMAAITSPDEFKVEDHGQPPKWQCGDFDVVQKMMGQVDVDLNSLFSKLSSTSNPSSSYSAKGIMCHDCGMPSPAKKAESEKAQEKAQIPDSSLIWITDTGNVKTPYQSDPCIVFLNEICLPQTRSLRGIWPGNIVHENKSKVPRMPRKQNAKIGSIEISGLKWEKNVIKVVLPSHPIISHIAKLGVLL